MRNGSAGSLPAELRRVQPPAGEDQRHSAQQYEQDQYAPVDEVRQNEPSNVIIAAETRRVLRDV